MKFWKRGGASQPATARGGSSSSLAASLKKSGSHDALCNSLPSISKQSADASPTSLPTRKQRMQLLKCIMHHADAVQKQYIVQKQLPSPTAAKPSSSAMSIDNMSKVFTRKDTTTAEINDKCYQRWHQVLQENLVTSAVHALNLLEASPAAAEGGIDDEDAYFATMEGMDEEIKIMAILARAPFVEHAAREGREGAGEGDGEEGDESKAEGEQKDDGMEQINAMMKCTAMLLFHIVLAASSPGSTDAPTEPNAADAAKDSSDEAKSAAGYDGRVRHVMKLACVDVLSRAIMEGVEAFDASEVSAAVDEEEEDQSTGPLDMDEYTSWNIPNLRAFLEQTDLGKDAIFGTPYVKKEKRESRMEADDQTVDSDGHSQSEGEKDASISPSKTEDSIDSAHSSSSSSLEVQSEEVKGTDDQSPEDVVMIEGKDNVADESSSKGKEESEANADEEKDSAEEDENKLEVDIKNEEDAEEMGAGNERGGDGEEISSPVGEDGESEAIAAAEDAMTSEQDDEPDAYNVGDAVTESEKEPEEDIVDELESRRKFNAKFLATRKFELIERLVAIDIVRFLMAEEREKKVREQEAKEQQRKSHKRLPSLLRRGNDSVVAESTEQDSTATDLKGGKSSDSFDKESKMEEAENGATGLEESKSGDGEDPNADQDVTSSTYLTASRIKQLKRGAKIAGAGLAIGTVFAISGGLAAPALAAGLSGLAALTGATTASSTAVLAVLATFKAGAALFGVGGGGLAAYKMKKRTAGLQEFEIRRENIEQYMSQPGDEAKIRKGVETMLPQLHTTVAVTGWLRENDVADFQLAWGIQPTCTYEKEEHKRRIRQMKRFYSIYNPPLVHLCEDFMETLQMRMKKDFCWDRIWSQLEQKYGANPDHMIPLDTPYDSEVFLTYEEKEMIDGVLSNAKAINFRRRGVERVHDFDEEDEIAELVAKLSPKKGHRKNMSSASATELATKLDFNEDELVTALESDLALTGIDSNGTTSDDEAGAASDAVVEESCAAQTGVVPSHPGKSLTLQERMAKQREQQTEFLKDKGEPKLQDDSPDLSVQVPSQDEITDIAPESSPTLQERMAAQREQQVSFLKDKGLLDNESDLREGAGSPKMIGTEDDAKEAAQDPPAKEEELEEQSEEERSPVVWDWKRLYGTADIHTVTWESKMLSSLCHIVENMALEVSSQATKVALQYSVIGAIISAVAIPSALITASKLIDDPYQIVVIRADEAGKELAKCLLESDERRPVTLVGFSFGARVVYSCLRELARQQEIWEESRKPKPNDTAEVKKSSRSSFMSSKKSKEEVRFEYDREPASLVADVIFIGLPRAIDKKVLTSCRRVTGGRLVNAYIKNDWLLTLMFMARGGTPCGTKPIQGVPGIENYDVTSMVETHTKYADAIPNILQHVRFSEP
ncbi:hypothetical protein ACHAXT_006182 [Thalassiosira profunda]